VAMTRAKDHLHLVVPQRFFVQQQRGNGDRHMYAVRTRFIPGGIIGNFDACAWPNAARPAPSGANAVTKPVDIGARLRAKWR
jgi:DNA helicase II / ATP-dependent DNA helicase PcrA